MRALQRDAATGSRSWSVPGLARGLATALVALAACALPPAVTPEDPPLVDAEPESAEASGLSEEQHRRLRAGGRVEELVELERRGQRYVGGVGYVLVRAAPRQVFEALNQLDTLSDVLPQTRSIQIVDRSGERVRVEIEQGNSVVSTRFTVVFERQTREADDAHLVRFWLDPARPHGIDDVWGFFRATRYDAERSLIAVGALVNLGPGLIRMLFEERIQRAILRMPNRVRDVVERPPASPGAALSSRKAPEPGSAGPKDAPNLSPPPSRL